MQKLYSSIFVYSSLITPFFLGIIAASAVSGAIDRDANNFLAAYVYSWLNWFSLSVGLFTVCICAYLAAVFIIGQTRNSNDKNLFIRKAKAAALAVFCSGALVFVAAWQAGIPLLSWIFGHPIGVVAIVSASISLLLMLSRLQTGSKALFRLLAGFQVSMILFAATYSHFPNILLFKDGEALSLLLHQGQAKTIDMLGYALLIGSLFILPALVYLIYVFQEKKSERPSH